VEVLVDREVVAWNLTDDPEVVHERRRELPVLQAALEVILRDADALVLVPGGQAGSGQPLRLEVRLPGHVAPVDGEGDQCVQVALE
jgi:hypothetical protein